MQIMENIPALGFKLKTVIQLWDSNHVSELLIIVGTINKKDIWTHS